MKIKYFIAISIIAGVVLYSLYFNKPNYVGNWKNIDEKQRLVILENNVAIYKIEGLSDIYGNWSEISTNEIVIKYKLFDLDLDATFKSNTGNVGYFNNQLRTIIFTRDDN